MQNRVQRSRLAWLAVPLAATIFVGGCAATRDMLGMGSSGAGGAVPVTLSGAEEVPPVTTGGSGKGTITVRADRTVSGSVTTTGVPGRAAHIHMAPRGQNGPIIVPMTMQGENTWVVAPGAKLTEAQFDAFRAGNLYVNVHTAANPGGEVRGQIRP
jgi:hypothetical protein